MFDCKEISKELENLGFVLNKKKTLYKLKKGDFRLEIDYAFRITLIRRKIKLELKADNLHDLRLSVLNFIA